ncbi:beta-2 adrenergic receptor-like [Hydractinia symbiolongicarpus]|uniref:beta-2 adrenergic receptor-like n=1 Tax=Hydractinia symbiolongicarpus TaxID=13093 RepID=UPI0025511769|nr:beta-2 adrenergic receptor-like [Hydractinia symbiolongicarpus]XP_057315756.1 beta-2 adrenergic receptor-like [Hydractinia symbiolongicarpus]
MKLEEAALTIFSLISITITLFGMSVGITQKGWRKRDGILLFNTFTIDIWFSIFAVCMAVHTENERIFSNLYMFMFLLSWANQALVTINRYVVITFPFKYKIILNRSKLTVLVVTIWSAVCSFIVLSCIFHSSYSKPSYEYTNHSVVMCFAAWLRTDVIISMLAAHGALLLVVYAFEFSLWRTAKGHQNRYRSITHAVRMKEQNIEHPKKLSVTQTLQRRFSFPQNQGMAVKRTPMLLLGAHLVSIIPYFVVCILFVVNGEAVLEEQYFPRLCVMSKICISFRPLVNVSNHLSKANVRRFKSFLIRTCSNNPSSEFYTEYYIENQKAVESLKLRRESAQSMVTEVSVV